MRVPPRIMLAGGVVAVGGGAYYAWHRHQANLDAAAIDEEAVGTLPEARGDPSASYGDTGYGSTYLSPPTSGVGGGGFGGTGEQQGSTLADILPLLGALNQLPAGPAVGGGLPAGPTPNTGPGVATVPPPTPPNHQTATPPPRACTWAGHTLSWWQNPQHARKRGHWHWPTDSPGKFSHTRSFAGHSQPDHRPCHR